MKLDRFSFLFSLLLVVILSGCMPGVKTIEAGYHVTNDNGAFTIIGASEDITSWESKTIDCKYQETFFGAKRAIVCPTPTDVLVYVALDSSGQIGKITVTPVNEAGLPIRIPK